jgi:AcrR family transcriptional regulator
MASTHAAQHATTERRPVRERLLAAADELFYREGINNVGIDRVLEHAGVAKASLYSTFGSKDELVKAYLEGRQATRRARIEGRLAREQTARGKLLAVFDALAETLAQPGFRGCAFIMANAERPGGDRSQPVSDVYRQWLRELLLQLAKETGASEPALLAQQLLLLYDGALIGAQMDTNVGAARAARITAQALIDAALSPNGAKGPRAAVSGRKVKRAA